MKLLLALGVSGLGLGLAIGLARWAKRKDVSPEWLVDHQRRSWGSGIDAGAWDWDEMRRLGRVRRFIGRDE